MSSPFPLAVVGGAGPLVSAHLQCELLRAYQRTQGAQLDDAFPAIVSFNQALSGVGPEGVVDGPRAAADVWALAQRAVACGARLAIAPCASLNPWLPEDTTGLKWIRWVDHAAHRLGAAGARRVGVIGSRSAQRDGVFRDPLERWGIEAVELPSALQIEADALIWQGMTGEFPAVDHVRLERCHDFFISQGCDAIWWGCTELSFLPDAWRPTLPCLTPMDSMVAAVMNRWENAWVDGLLAQPTPITVVPSTETIA